MNEPRDLQRFQENDYCLGDPQVAYASYVETLRDAALFKSLDEYETGKAEQEAEDEWLKANEAAQEANARVTAAALKMARLHGQVRALSDFKSGDLDAIRDQLPVLGA